MRLSNKETHWVVVAEVISFVATLLTLWLVLRTEMRRAALAEAVEIRLQKIEQRVKDLEAIRDAGKHLVPPKSD